MSEQLGLGITAVVMFVAALGVSQIQGEHVIVAGVTMGLIIGGILSLVAMAKS